MISEIRQLILCASNMRTAALLLAIASVAVAVNMDSLYKVTASNDTSNGDWSAGRSPIWKVFCNGGPIYRGRIDPIVTPGEAAGHVHKVFGGNKFSEFKKGQSPIDVYTELKSSACTSCTISKVDNSNYWHPEM